MMRLFKFAVCVCLVLLMGRAGFAQSAASTGTESGIDLNAIDKSADPCADFYQYACGAWMKNNPIPPDQSSWGSFDLLFERNQTTLRDILEDSKQNQSRSPVDQKIGAFYGSCMDEGQIEKQGKTPLMPELNRISQISDADQLLDQVARLHTKGVNVFFVFSSTPDPNNAQLTIADLDQSGLGLPEKDFYFRTDANSIEIRKKYVAHMAKMFQLLGVSEADATKKADSVMALETELAKNSLDITSRRNPQLLVHDTPKSDLAKLVPSFNFVRYFTQVGTPEFSRLNVSVPDFFKGLNTLLEKQDLNNVKDYLTWRYVSSNASRLPKAFVDENFDFYSRTLRGAKENRPRWKRCVTSTDLALGEALGQKYVEKTFGEQGKQRTVTMVQEIEGQMAKDINALSWMSPETKEKALEKLHKVANKIGYPEKWRDYSSVELKDDDYLGNWSRAAEFEAKREWAKIGKPVDHSEWHMTPPTVNAYYDPQQNNINFPAGILQPPFYSNKATDAVNYGAVGVVVGHELTHGFDDQGRQFDADGNVKNWWQKSDEEKFTALADCLVNEYGGFSPVKGIELNGKLTLGENTADNGGLRLAYMALLENLAKNAVPVSKKADDYTQPQLFFLGYAQVWCENVRPEQARTSARTDPHAPGRFRTNGVVMNVSQFAEAFGCKTGDKMVPVKGCRVW